MSARAFSVCAIVCAAGKGERAGFSKNKLLVPVGGRTVLERTVSAFDFPEIEEILITVSEEDREEISRLFAGFPKVRVVSGGATRTQSGFRAREENRCDIVLVHDGARPFVSRRCIENCIQSVKTFGSGVCAVPSVDTVALADENGAIASVPPRNRAYSVQTPQGFFAKELLGAYRKALAGGGEYTDDSSVYAAFVSPPRLCEGSRDNKKLTYPEDFSDGFARTGIGIDTHAFGKPQDFILLAGVKIPSDSGLVAHSDGDVLVHAVMDAMLSAAGLKDIGHYFPDTDERWSGADSMNLLSEVRRKILTEGFAVKNLSVAVLAEKPRLSKYIDAMRLSLADALGLDPAAVGISAGTNEGLGYVGEGKGITVYANVLLKSL